MMVVRSEYRDAELTSSLFKFGGGGGLVEFEGGDGGDGGGGYTQVHALGGPSVPPPRRVHQAK